MFYRLLFATRCLLTRFVCGLALLCFLPAQAGLPEPIIQLLDEYQVDESQISIWMAPVSGEPLIEHRANLPRNPASVTKLFTTGTGLLILGEDYRFTTSFYFDTTKAQISQGTLAGNLYIKGTGDPYFVIEDLQQIVNNLRAQGITRIAGNLVLDNFYFDLPEVDPNDFDGNGLEPYNAVPTPLSINFRTHDLYFSANSGSSTGAQVDVRIEPPLHKTQVINQVHLNQQKRCSGEGFQPIIKPDTEQQLLVISGEISTACQDIHLYKVISSAEDLFYGHFKTLWEASGGQLDGTWYVAKTPDTAEEIYTWQSKPLGEQIQAMNKHSNNVMTRQLFLNLGANLYQAPSTLQKSREAVISTLNRLHIDTHSLFIDNGSGLSRQARSSAKQLGEFLQAMSRVPAFPVFFNSLAIAGSDGTLRKRFRNTSLSGNLVGKTGTLKKIKAIAGYFYNSQQKLYSFAILIEGNQYTSPLQDKILLWLAQYSERNQG